MLSIIYNGIKPNEYKFEYSVIDNNKVDFIDFSFGDLPSGTPFVKIESKDKKYVDKIDVSEYVSNGHIVFPLLAKTTAHKFIRVQLSFETSETKWQTEVVEITLKNSVRADEEIANNYPTALQNIESELENHEERIETLEHATPTPTKNEHNFIKYTKETGLQGCRLTLLDNCQVLLTENVNKCSKLVRSRYIGKKQGNTITPISLGQGTYTIGQLIEAIFGVYEEEDMSAWQAQQQINNEIGSIFHGTWIIYQHCARGYRKFYTVLKENLSRAIQDTSYKINNAMNKINNVQTLNCNCVMRLQFKFVKDFELRGETPQYGWNGTMANVYLDCLVYAFKTSPHIYISPMVKRF